MNRLSRSAEWKSFQLFKHGWLQVRLIVKHEEFDPLSSPGGDGRNDIALLYIRTREGRGIQFDKFVGPACLPAMGTKLKR